jgi:hypothetical protein
MALITGNLFEGRSRQTKRIKYLFDDQLPNFVLRDTRAGAKAFISKRRIGTSRGKRIVRFTLGVAG